MTDNHRHRRDREAILEQVVWLTFIAALAALLVASLTQALIHFT